MLLQPSVCMTFKSQRRAYFSLRTVTTHANAQCHQDLRGY